MFAHRHPQSEQIDTISAYFMCLKTKGPIGGQMFVHSLLMECNYGSSLCSLRWTLQANLRVLWQAWFYPLRSIENAVKGVRGKALTWFCVLGSFHFSCRSQHVFGRLLCLEVDLRIRYVYLLSYYLSQICCISALLCAWVIIPEFDCHGGARHATSGQTSPKRQGS